MHFDLSRCDAIMVDLDGTLVDTLGDFHVALNRMLADLELPPVDAQAVESRVGKGSEHLVQSVLALVLDPGSSAAPSQRAIDATFERAFARYQHHYRATNGHFAKVYPGAIEALRAWRSRGLALACLTNKPGEFASALLADKGLDKYFGPVFGGDAFERKKPDPLPLLMTCEALGTAPARTLMVGDSVNDAQAARAAGCPIVLVSYGYNHGQPVREIDADGYVDALSELR